MKKIYFLLISLIAISTTNVNAQLLTWNTFGNLGTETTEPSVTNNANIAAANLTQGAGITPAGNANRFGGSNWWNTGNSANSTLAEAITGNDYLQFIVTPNVGFSFTPTSFVFVWDRSGTGPSNVTLRSSVDAFASDIGSITGIVGAAFATNTITITGLTNLTTATTFRLYGYNGTATGGTGGFDINVNAVNVTLNGTSAPIGGVPLITVTPTSLTGFTSFVSPAFSAEQMYTVSGIDLTANIDIVPPTGFEISPTTGPFTPTNPITLTQVGGTVTTTTIYVRMNSATLGINTGNITHTSAGSNNPTVSLTGKVLDVEPTVQSAITFGAVTNSTIVVNFSGGNGAKRILVARAGAAVNSDPVDGTTYAGNANFGSGTQLGTGNYAVYTGTLNTQLVTGLTAGTTYHFAVYEYNDGGGVSGAENYLVPGGINNTATLTTVNTYAWAGGNGVWTTPGNWIPSRDFPATNDSLLFFSGGAPFTVTGVPNETIGYLGISGSTKVTLQAAVATTTLNIGNGNTSGTNADLELEAGSQLNISGALGYTINMLTTAIAIINGDMTFSGGIHKFTAADASGVNFNGSFTVGAGLTGAPFGSAGTTASVVFATGSVMSQASGSNPFQTAGGLVSFQTGSLYRITSSLFTPSYSGRTYADVEIDAPGYAVSSTGGGALSIDNLTITNGLQNLNLTALGISIKGNISIAPGATLGFNPIALNTLTFNGTAAQSITNSGTFTYGPLENLTINNAAGVTINSNITLGATTTLTLTSGILNFIGTTLTMSSGTTLAGTLSNTTFVDGKVKKIGLTDFVFPVGKTGYGYAPIEIKNSVGGTTADEFTAEYIRGSAVVLGPITAGPGLDHVSHCDYWTLSKGIATPTSVDVTLYWSAINGCGGTYIDDLGSLTIGHFDGAGWNSFPVTPIITGSIATGTITWPGVTAFSPFSIAGATFGVNPLPITINYFTGTKQNGNHLLNWKVTCNSTPGVTMEIQRSSDGRNYAGIYTITATALQCLQPFNYSDAQPLAGVNYYRLKMTDANGKVTYSSIVPLINADKGFDVINIAPNPIVGGNFKLNISAAQKAQLEMVITDMQGRVMQKQSTNAIAGFNTIPVNVSNLASGTYQLFVNTSEGRSRVLRFVVQ